MRTVRQELVNRLQLALSHLKHSQTEQGLRVPNKFQSLRLSPCSEEPPANGRREQERALMFNLWKKFWLVGKSETSHKCVHDNRKDFQCPICHKLHGLKNNLDGHIKSVHENIRKCQCPMCKYSTGFKSIVKKHIKIVHEKKRNFQRPICNQKFGVKTSMNRHIETVHNNKKATMSVEPAAKHS